MADDGTTRKQQERNNMNPNQPVNRYKEIKPHFDSYTLKEPNFDSFTLNHCGCGMFYNMGWSYGEQTSKMFKHKNHCPFLHDCDPQEWMRRIRSIEFNKAIRNMTIDELVSSYNLIPVPLELPR